MSFLTNKSVGLMLIIVGLVNLIAGIGTVVAGFTDDSVDILVAICRGIASLIFGALMLLYGIKVRGGPNDESDIVSGLIRTLGVAIILKAIFIAIADGLDAGSITTGIWTALAQIVIGLFLIWVSGKVGGKNKNALSKILWVILIIAFLVLAILEFVGIFNEDFGSLWGIMMAISAICMCLIYIYCFIAMLSKDVKSSMGI